MFFIIIYLFGEHKRHFKNIKYFYFLMIVFRIKTYISIFYTHNTY